MRKKIAFLLLVAIVISGALLGYWWTQVSGQKDRSLSNTPTGTPAVLPYANLYPMSQSKPTPYPTVRKYPAVPSQPYPPPVGPGPTYRLIPTPLPPEVPAGMPTPAYTNPYYISSIYFVNPRQGWVIGGQGSPHNTDSIYHTEDGGKTWLRLSEFVLPQNDQNASYPGQILFFNENDGLLFSNRLFSTHDGGQTWQSEGYSGLQRTATGWIGRGVGFWGKQGDSIWALERECPAENKCKDTLLESVSISSWEPQPLTLPVTQTLDTLILRSNAATAWLLATPSVFGEPLALFITRDGARSWQALPGIPNENFCDYPQLASAGDRLWLLCQFVPATIMLDKKLYLSEDGGLTWSLKSSTFLHHQIGSLPLAGIADQLDAVGENSLFLAMGRNTMWGSFDGGLEWDNVLGISPAEFEVYNLRSIFFVDSNHGWAVANNLVFRTDDGGHSWEITTITLPYVPTP